jgi:predicted RNA binding protein YcfA (HicA-like mRNA interferase family)
LPNLASFDVYNIVMLGIILWYMRRLRNWTYRDVTVFLRTHGFSYQKPLKGSHQRWTKLGENGEPDRQVELHLPRNGYEPKTLKSMIRQSGVDVEEWLKWAGS